MVARVRRGLHADALLQAIFTQIGTPGPGANGDVDFSALRRHAHFFRPVVHQRADVGTFQFVGAYHFFVGFVNRFFVVGNFHLEDMRRIEQTACVILQTENRCAATGVVGTDTFKHAHPIVQGVGQNVRIGVTPGNQLAIQPDKTVAVRHRHDVNPLNYRLSGVAAWRPDRVILADFLPKIRIDGGCAGLEVRSGQAVAVEMTTFGKMPFMNSQKHRWKPSVTVAALIERDGRFLVVEEETSAGLRFNQPAGHLDEGESLVAACIREALEETGCHVTPEALVGVYQWTVPAGDITYLRFAFACRLDQIDTAPQLDDGIVATHWLTLAELRASQSRHRSPLVLQCVEDWGSGRRLPLDSVRHYEFP